MKKQNRYRNRISKSLFESEDTHTILSNLGNPLTALDNLIDFEMFRPELEAALSNKERKSNAGRKPFEPVQGSVFTTLLRPGRPSNPIPDC